MPRSSNGPTWAVAVPLLLLILVLGDTVPPIHSMVHGLVLQRLVAPGASGPTSWAGTSV